MPITVTLLKLPSGAKRMWWHEAMGVFDKDPAAGQGIRVGVVDTGFTTICGLEHIDVRDVDGRKPTYTESAELPHGEMVARLIAQHNNGADEFGGIAPAATVHAIDASGPSDKLNPVKVVNAIVKLAEIERCDIINLSAGHDAEQPGLRQAIVRAAAVGTLCIVAAGNDIAPKVSYPARYDECVAVGGVGSRGWGPEGTVVRQYSDFAVQQAGRSGALGELELFHDPFSCYGQGLNMVAPSVGIVICRGNQAAACATGTSFAAPLVTGVLAAALSGDKAYSAIKRGPARTRYARMVLERICKRTGISLEREGLGVPGLAI